MTTKQTHASVKPVVVTVRIPAELHQRLSQAAHARGMSQSLLIAQAIEKELDTHDAQAAFKASRQDAGYTITQHLPAGTRPMGVLTDEEIDVWTRTGTPPQRLT